MPATSWPKRPPAERSLTWPLASLSRRATRHGLRRSNGVYRSRTAARRGRRSQDARRQHLSRSRESSAAHRWRRWALHVNERHAITTLHGGCRSPSSIRLRRIPRTDCCSRAARRTTARRCFKARSAGRSSPVETAATSYSIPIRRRRALRRNRVVLHTGGANVFQFYRCQSGGCTERSVGIDISVGGPFIPRIGMDPSNSSTLCSPPHDCFRTDDRADSGRPPRLRCAGLQRCWQDAANGRSCANAPLFRRRGRRANNVADGLRRNAQWRRVADDDRGATWRSVAGTEAGPLPVRAVNDIVVDPLRSSRLRGLLRVRQRRIGNAVTCSARRMAARRGRTSPPTCRTCR